MFGFLRKREKGSAYKLDLDQERRLHDVERDIARLKKDIVELFISQTLSKTDIERTGEKEDGTPEKKIVED